MSQPGAEVVPGVHRLGTDMVNWYLVEADGGLVAVDSGLPGYAELMEHELEALGRRPEDVKAVVITHGHSDHTGLANRFAAAGARVLVPEGDLELARRPRPQRTDGSVLAALRHGSARRFVWHLVRHGALRPARLTDPETYADGAELDVPGRPRALHTPGHTAGHCALHFPQHRALFVADLLCTWNPITGRPGAQPFPSVLNVSTPDLIASLARIEPVDADAVLPGHGDPVLESPAAVARAARAAAG